MFKNWELAHTAYAVDRLETWMPRFELAFGGTWTTPLVVEANWRTTLDGTGAVRQIKGTARWLVGPNPPIELWEGPPGSPWHVPPGTMRLDHLAYWGEDMEAQATQLETLGYHLELTPVVDGHDLATDGPYRGFANFKNAHGDRVEIQRAGDKPAVARWLAGGEMEPHYPTRDAGAQNA